MHVFTILYKRKSVYASFIWAASIYSNFQTVGVFTDNHVYVACVCCEQQMGIHWDSFYYLACPSGFSEEPGITFLKQLLKAHRQVTAVKINSRIIIY